MDSNISHKDFFSVLDLAEKTFNRDGWRVRDVDVWPLIKIYYSYFVLTQVMDKRGSQIQKFQGKISKGIRALYIIWRSFFAQIFDKTRNEKIRETDVLIFVQSSTRYFKIDGNWYSPYSDTFQTAFASRGVNSLVCETTEDGKFLFPRFGSSLLIQKKLLLNMIAAKAKSMIFADKLLECENKLKFNKIIDDMLGPEFRPDWKKINFHVNNLFQQIPYFVGLLEATNSKICMMSGYYSSTMFALTLACRQTGIKTVEIQHGVQGSAHLAYRSWHNLPSDNSNIMPDYFWTWGIAEKETIENWSNNTCGRHSVFVGGNPCLTVFNLNGENISKIETFSGYSFPVGEVSKVIIFTCQAFDNLPASVIECMRARPDYGWVFRIHPQYWQTEYSILSQCKQEGFDNVIIDRGEFLPLSSAMQFATVHMTEFSSSVLEASTVGLHSIVIHSYGRELFNDLFETGAASYADNFNGILRAIETAPLLKKSEFAETNEKVLGEGISKIINIFRGRNFESRDVAAL
jgi:hypothetical protein